ncbi:MAG: hypothetical protein BroJett011_39030 [Chloroflexota bacterium]|nr:MAG: hypothetical protein BroJett011_39030 [Chloroflexota bacterium]
MSALSLPTVVMASISFYVGLYHLLIYLRRRQHREDLTFGLMCLATSLYEVCCAGLYSATSVAEGVQWQRMQFIALAFFTTAFLWFVADYTSQKPQRAIYAFSAFFLLAVLIQIVDRSSLTWLVDRPSIKEILLPFGLEITYYEVTMGPFTTFQGLMGLVAATYIVWNGVRFYRRGSRREAAPLLLALGFMYAASVNDTAVSNGLYQFIYAIEYVYLAMILLMAYSLSNTVVEAAMAEEALRESEIFLETIIEYSPHAMWVSDDKGTLMRMNQACRDLLHVTDEDLVGKYNILADNIVEEQGAMPLVKRVFEHGERVRFTLHYDSSQLRSLRLRETAQAILEVTISPILDTQKRVIHAIIQHLDITELKQAEEALQESEEKFRSLVENALAGVFAVDEAYHFIYANDELCRLLGYSREELLGRDFREVLSEPSRAIVTDRYIRRQRGEQVPPRYELEVMRRDNEVRYAEMSVAVVKDATGRPRSMGQLVDITERRRAERIIQLRLRLMEFAATHSLEELLQKTLDEVGELTNSPIGFYHFVEADQKTLSLQAWSTRTVAEFCQAEGQGLHYPIDQAGVWVDCVRERRAVIHNDYQSLPHRKGLPEGHAPVMRELVVPILRDERIVAILGVGNKPQNYTDADAEVAAYVADLAWEITERKRAEEALHLTRFTVEHVADAVYWIDPQARIVDVNEAACRILGYTREELTRMSLSDIDPDFAIAQWPKTWKYLKEMGKLTRESKHRTQDGQIIPVEIVANFIEFGGRELDCAVVRDITERKRAEALLRESEARWRSLVESAPAVIMTVDADGRVLTANRSVSGKDIAQIIGTSMYSYLHPKYQAQVREAVEAVFRTGAPQNYEIHEYVPSGGEYWFETHLAAIRPAGEVEAVILISIDVTERKRAEEQIRRLNVELELRVSERTEELQTANKELESFAYSVSHDLRAPLRAIDGYTRILIEDYEPVLDAEGQRVCTVIRDNTQRMGQLIDDLLAFSRLGRTQLRSTAIDMTTLVKGVFEELMTPEGRSQVDFRLAPLPLAVGDPTLIRQVWINLLSNALKFSAKQEWAVIEVRGRQEAGENVYSVHDNGVGFDTRYIDKLFGVFQRLHSEREFNGTGVGLAIVQRVIHRHGGRVWAEGAVDKGATFYFTLPASLAADTVIGAPQP